MHADSPSFDHEDPKSSLRQAENLPLPVRGTRYIVGAILVSVIVTVVLTTYLRIEQQLQATLESQLQAVLREHVETAGHWIENTKGQTRAAASLSVLRGLKASDPVSLRQAKLALETIHATSEAEAISLLDMKSGQAILTEPREEPPCALAPAALSSLPSHEARVDFSTLPESGRIFAAARVPGQPLALVMAIYPSALARDLDPSAHGGDHFDEAETYAFNSEGWFDRASRSVRQTQSPDGLPPMALASDRGASLQDQQVGEYRGRRGAPVVGAWIFREDFGFGIATEMPRSQAHASIDRLRRSFLVLVTLVGAALLGFIALGRWTLRVQEESRLMTRRLSRLARAIQPLSAALENDPSAVVLADHDGMVVYANAASHRLLGVSRPLLGQDVDAVFESLPHELQAALASGQDSIVAQGGDTDGETLLVSGRSLMIDQVGHYLYMLRPVTQQVRRQEVEHWKKLIRVLSHELNNALAPITSLLSSARKVNQMSHQDARLGQIFESIQERTGHLIAFIEGYREVARLPRPALRPADWETFLNGIEAQKAITRRGRAPTTEGYFDPIQLERVAINLINNAYEAGSLKEDVEIEVVEEERGFRLEVADRGSGMPEAVLKQAMLPFFSTKRTGTGVGLALSREIIEAHGGQLTLANREGGGLLVSCFLPKAPPPSRGSISKIPLTGT